MKSFNLEKARAGHPVCDGRGRNVRILCVDKKGIYPVCGIVENDDGYEDLECWTLAGTHTDTFEITEDSLFMKEEKEEEKTYFVLYHVESDNFFGHIERSSELIKIDRRFKEIGYKLAEIAIKRISDVEEQS